MNQILVVDDEVGIRELLSEILQDEGYLVRLAENAGQARALRSQNRPDLVLLDIWMPDTDGITLLKEWASSGLLTMPVIVMSGHGTIDTAVEATRIGAYDFLEKPITLQKLLTTVGRALRRGELQQRSSISLAGLGKSPVIQELKQRLENIINNKSPVLFLSEIGAGVEHCARYLHVNNTPWIAPENFAMLAQAPLDLLQQARDGTIFISEISELNKLEQKGLQLMLNKLTKYNVRLVCACTRPITEIINNNMFDARLLQELSTISIKIPSLREHREDIPELANLILANCIEMKQCPPREFNIAALNALRNYDWPGNLKQLENVIKSLALTALGEEISLNDVNAVLMQPETATTIDTGQKFSFDLSLRDARDAFERAYFEYHINQESGNMSRVADRVGLERTHLYRKLKQLGIKTTKKNGE